MVCKAAQNTLYVLPQASGNARSWQLIFLLVCVDLSHARIAFPPKNIEVKRTIYFEREHTHTDMKRNENIYSSTNMGGKIYCHYHVHEPPYTLDRGAS